MDLGQEKEEGKRGETKKRPHPSSLALLLLVLQALASLSPSRESLFCTRGRIPPPIALCLRTLNYFLKCIYHE